MLNIQCFSVYKCILSQSYIYFNEEQQVYTCLTCCLDQLGNMLKQSYE